MIASTIARFRNDSLNNPAMSLSDPATWDAFTAGSESDSGVVVSHASALALAPVWQALATISGDVAMCPLNVYRRLAEDDREIDRNHPAQYLMTVAANEETSAFEMWRRALVHACLWGNGFIHIAREFGVGAPLALTNLLPDRTTAMHGTDNRLYYVTHAGGKEVVLDRSEVIHIKGMSFDNGVGKDLVEAARDAWGLALAAQGFAGRFFANGAQGGGLLEIPPSYTPKSAANLAEGFDKKYTGKSNWFKTVILREGAKFHQTTIDADKSQMNESRESDVRSVARYFNLPGFKLGIPDSVSYNSSEQGQIAYKTGCLAHWFKAVASEVAIKVLSLADLRSRARFVEHNSSVLIEADSKTTNEVLAIQRTNMIISADEWRRKINLNKRPDGQGGTYENPNTSTGAPPSGAGGGGKPPAEPDDDDGADATARMTLAEEAVVADVVGRMARRLSLEAQKRSDKPERFAEWVEHGLREFEHVVATAFAPMVLLLSAGTGESTVALGERLRLAFIEAAWKRLSVLFDKAGQIIDPDQLAAGVAASCQRFENTIIAEMASIMEIDHA
jgi:HK97 family phage portal protein